MNDEKVFPNPAEFNPDRHISKSSTTTTEMSNKKANAGDVENGSEGTAANDPSALVFGFGRR